MKLPKNGPAASSRKTRISKKARSHPGGASSGTPKKIGNIMSGIKHFRGLPAAACRMAALSRARQRRDHQPAFHPLSRPRRTSVVRDCGLRSPARPRFPRSRTVEGVEIRQVGRGAQTKLLPGRRLEYVFEYLVSSYETGQACAAGIRSDGRGLENPHRTARVHRVQSGRTPMVGSHGRRAPRSVTPAPSGS